MEQLRAILKNDRTIEGTKRREEEELCCEIGYVSVRRAW